MKNIRKMTTVDWIKYNNKWKYVLDSISMQIKESMMHIRTKIEDYTFRDFGSNNPPTEHERLQRLFELVLESQEMIEETLAEEMDRLRISEICNGSFMKEVQQ